MHDDDGATELVAMEGKILEVAIRIVTTAVALGPSSAKSWGVALGVMHDIAHLTTLGNQLLNMVALLRSSASLALAMPHLEEILQWKAMAECSRTLASFRKVLVDAVGQAEVNITSSCLSAAWQKTKDTVTKIMSAAKDMNSVG